MKYFIFKSIKLCLLLATARVYSSTSSVPPIEPCDPLSAATGCNQCTEREPCLPDSYPFQPGVYNGTLTCTRGGHCVRGSVPIDPWLTFALKTQREVQGHNAFSTRADGYGDYDTCEWPPPYDPLCLGVANQEFTFTDMLNMGVRGFEIDLWWCYDELRMAHLNLEAALLCLPTNRPFRDGLQEIEDWLNMPGNENEIIRIMIDVSMNHSCFNEDYIQTTDAVVNEIIQSTIGDRVLTPDYLQHEFNGQWPTMRRMRETGKTIVINGNGAFLHGEVYMHPAYWDGRNMKSFKNYPDCGGRYYRNTTLRFYGDATKFGPFYSGPRSTGIITDFSELVRCGVQISSADMLNPSLMRTAVSTWAENEPSIKLTSQSCVYIRLSTRRWHATDECKRNLTSACQSRTDPDDWTLSGQSPAYDSSECQEGYEYSIPKNGFQQEMILEKMESSSSDEVWINYEPWLPDDTDPGSGAKSVTTIGQTLIKVTIVLGLIFLL
ncbi:uncharacterized protein MT2135-like [Antedon mediterranea]|uniref:uncharacterized protein MT2135-like n=1 Tax=Antedon mediterranea TaxID=105859 RepID=UPI003AF4C486